MIENAHTKIDSALHFEEFLILDGGMGTMLQAAGLEMGGIPELWNLDHPDKIIDIHRAYLRAGANVIYANTFGANRHKMNRTGHGVTELIKAAIQNAKQAIALEGVTAYVALDVGPIGMLLEPTGTLSFEEAYDMFVEEIESAHDADLIVLETMTDLQETRAGVLAAKEHSDKPILVTMSFEENGRTFTGCEISAMAVTLEGLGVNAVGVNCSLGPEELISIVEELCKWTSLPVIVKPNAGLPDPETNAYYFEASLFAEYMVKFADMGASIFGGCCGTTPEHIAALAKVMRHRKPKGRDSRIPTVVCSSIKTIIVDQPRIIGERINPTGKKRFQVALHEHDMDYILGQAIEQMNAGAEILDVNVGLPGIDEPQMLVDAIKAIQGVSEIPLQLDTTDLSALERGLRVYCGKPKVNTDNGEEESLSTVLPLVKKYGASVIGLTLDKNGIPPTADGRFAIAKRIYERALAYGIRKEDVHIDCLTLTASAEQEGVNETLRAVARVHNELGLHVALGVSNISFGLPNRELVTSTFLTMAMQNGLDLPIINPNIEAIAGAVRAYRLLACHDKNSVEFINYYTNQAPPKQTSTSFGVVSNDLHGAVMAGLNAQTAEITKRLLCEEHVPAMEIINERLIPALDDLGSNFESGKMFLPQLISGAGAAQAAFEVIKSYMLEQGGESVERGIVVLATVKGDIHDIGKNIVKILLENYGFCVIDLGKDVPYQTVVDATLNYHAPLVGLSALMTTTLVSMEETIKLLREHCPFTKIVVGGAVLTPDYAMKIGADYYAKDAKETVDIARSLMG